MDKQDAQLLEDITKHGWHVIKVKGDQGEPDFAYSVGLHNSATHPDIVITGLPPDVLHGMINTLVERIKAGEVFEEGGSASGIVAWPNSPFDYKVYFRNVDKEYFDDFFGAAQWYYRGNDFAMVQAVWPDKNNFYPWDDQMDARWKMRQVKLFK